MRVAALVHFYVPFRNAGSETMLHTLLRELADNGHDVRVFATDIPEAPYSFKYENIQVNSTNWFLAQQELLAFEPDVVIAHHHNTPNAVALGKQLGVPSVFLVHNDHEVNREYLACDPDLVMFNAEWVRDVTHYKGESVVIRPPVFPEEHQTTPGDRVTLVNMNYNKGGAIFSEIAATMPDVQFLGVIGGYGEQIKPNLSNVEIVEHTDNMRDHVWSRTRILLMPSDYESYGMAGVEAFASGIPVIANPTPGLREALGSAGVFVPREDVDGLRTEIRRLLDPTEWQAASRRALQRSAELDPAIELDKWVTRIEKLAL